MPKTGLRIKLAVKTWPLLQQVVFLVAMAAIVSRQLDKFGQYTVDVSSSVPLVEDPSEELIAGKEMAREFHTKGHSMHRPKQSLDEEASQLWTNWQVRRARSLGIRRAPTSPHTPRQERAKNMFGKREYKTAERYYGEAIAISPDARLYSNRAACRLAQVCVRHTLTSPAS
jgi:hypothetical protein